MLTSYWVIWFLWPSFIWHEFLDNEAPVFQSCQSPDTVYVTMGTNESRVVWDPDVVSAVDAVDGPVAISCSFVDGNSTKAPVTSNDTFPLGVTTVECEARDAVGNKATTCTFSVTVSGKRSFDCLDPFCPKLYLLWWQSFVQKQIELTALKSVSELPRLKFVSRIHNGAS